MGPLEIYDLFHGVPWQFSWGSVSKVPGTDDQVVSDRNDQTMCIIYIIWSWYDIEQELSLNSNYWLSSPHTQLTHVHSAVSTQGTSICLLMSSSVASEVKDAICSANLNPSESVAFEVTKLLSDMKGQKCKLG